MKVFVETISKGPGDAEAEEFEEGLSSATSHFSSFSIERSKLSPHNTRRPNPYVFAAFINDTKQDVVRIAKFFKDPARKECIKKLSVVPLVVLIFKKQINFKDFEFFVKAFEDVIPKIFFNIKIFHYEDTKTLGPFVKDYEGRVSRWEAERLSFKDPYKIYEKTINSIQCQEKTYQFFMMNEVSAKREDAELRKDYLYSQFHQYLPSHEERRVSRRIFYFWASLVQLTNLVQGGKHKVVLRCAEIQDDATLYLSILRTPRLLCKIDSRRFNESYQRDTDKLIRVMSNARENVILLDIEWWYVVALNYYDYRVRNMAIKSLVHLKRGDFSAAVDILKWITMIFVDGGYCDLNRIPKRKLGEEFWKTLEQKSMFNLTVLDNGGYNFNIDIMFSRAGDPSGVALGAIEELHDKCNSQMDKLVKFGIERVAAVRGRVPPSTFTDPDFKDYNSLKFLSAFRALVNHLRIMNETGPTSVRSTFGWFRRGWHPNARPVNDDLFAYNNEYQDSWNTKGGYSTRHRYRIVTEHYIDNILKSLKKHQWETLYLDPEGAAYSGLTKNPLYYRRILNELIEKHKDSLGKVRHIYFPDCYLPLIDQRLAKLIWGEGSVFLNIEFPYIFNKLHLFEPGAIKYMLAHKIISLPSQVPDLETGGGYLNTELKTFKNLFTNNHNVYLARLKYCQKISNRRLGNYEYEFRQRCQELLPKILSEKIEMDCAVSLRRCTDKNFQAMVKLLQLKYTRSQLPRILSSPDLFQFNVDEKQADFTCAFFYDIIHGNISNESLGSYIKESEGFQWPKRRHFRTTHWLAYMAVLFNRRDVLTEIMKSQHMSKNLKWPGREDATIGCWLASVALGCNNVDILKYLIQLQYLQLDKQWRRQRAYKSQNNETQESFYDWTFRHFIKIEIIKYNIKGYGIDFQIKPEIIRLIQSQTVSHNIPEQSYQANERPTLNSRASYGNREEKKYNPLDQFLDNFIDFSGKFSKTSRLTAAPVPGNLSHSKVSSAPLPVAPKKRQDRVPEMGQFGSRTKDKFLRVPINIKIFRVIKNIQQSILFEIENSFPSQTRIRELNQILKRLNKNLTLDSSGSTLQVNFPHAFLESLKGLSQKEFCYHPKNSDTNFSLFKLLNNFHFMLESSVKHDLKK